MLSKTSVDEVFMHHFEKMSSAYGGFAPTLPPGSGPGPFWGTSFLQTPTLPTPGKKPSFRPPHYPPLEKILQAPMFYGGFSVLVDVCMPAIMCCSERVKWLCIYVFGFNRTYCECTVLYLTNSDQRYPQSWTRCKYQSTTHIVHCCYKYLQPFYLKV